MSAKLISRAAAAAALASLAQGCFSLECTPMPRIGGEQMLVSNYGWYLFDAIPLACGNASEDRLTPWVFFRNDVRMDKIQKRFTDRAARRGMNIEEMTYKTKESVMFEIPSLNFPLPIPYFLTYHEIQLSGVAVPRGQAAEASAK